MNDELANRQSEYIPVFGTGHCGTKWLARAFTFPDHGMVFYHEKKFFVINETHNFINPWQTLANYEQANGIGDLHQPYWKWLEAEMKDNLVVGDSNSWTVNLLPQIRSILPVKKSILLVRNGISTLHSMFTHSKTVSLDRKLLDQMAEFYPDLFSSKQCHPLYLKWVMHCRSYGGHDYMRNEIRKTVGEDGLREVRLEDITSDPEVFRSTVAWLRPGIDIDDKTIQSIQKDDQNRKNKGTRDPVAIWATWNQTQKFVFKRICGESMEYYGYPMP